MSELYGGLHLLHDTANQLVSLPRLSKSALSELWLELFKKQPAKQIRKELMVRVLAYRIQEQAFGSLSVATRTRLRQLAREFKINSTEPISAAPGIKPGTRLIRQWQGQTHTVTVDENSYEYQGKRYPSLSKIARHITGTRWSGPLFFGLKAHPARKKADAC
jgi:hypothetical protein